MRLLLITLALAILLSACAQAPAPRTFVIAVEGNHGLDFRGSYMVVSGGKSTSRSVEGTIPQKFTVTGSLVSCSFQKQTEGGLLSVEIREEGKTLAEDHTTASYGVVTAAAR